MKELYVVNINTYRRIALNCFNEFCNCEKKQEQCSSFVMGKDGVEFGYALEVKKYEFAVQTIVFSAMSVEAFANDLILNYLGEKSVEYLEKISIVYKILAGTKFITQQEFPKDKKAYFYLKELVTLRNDLVHAKPVKLMSAKSDIYFKIEKDKLENAIQTFELVVKEIGDLRMELEIYERYCGKEKELTDWYYEHA